ncbi:IS110 family transposase [Candidatus Sumerlaeota bacterium]
MSRVHYVGLDVHKKTIAYCVKTKGGTVRDEGTIRATREGLDQLMLTLQKPWAGALEATLFTGWIYDHLKPHARELKVAHPLMLRAIAASKKKNDRVDAQKIADLLRVDLLPECYMADEQTRQLRRVLRFRTMVVQQATRMKNKVSGLLMEVGEPYNKEKLHGKKYFEELMTGLEHTPVSVKELMRLSRGALEFFEDIQQRLRKGLKNNPLLVERVERLMTIPGVGEIVALTWALEIDDPARFGSIGRAISYCGLCSAQDRSAGRDKRGPLSKQRNKHLQHVLVEAAKLAPRWSPSLARVNERERARGNPNRATLAVARKMVAYLMAVDRSGQPFEERG